MLSNFLSNEQYSMVQEMLDYCCICEALEETAKPSYGLEIVTEGKNIQSIKSMFSEDSETATDAIKKGNRNYSNGNYTEAKKNYQEALKTLEKMKKELTGMHSDVGSTILSWLVDGCLVPISALMMLKGTIITRKFTSYKNLGDAMDDTMSYNTMQNAAVAVLIKEIKWCQVRIHQCESEMGK